jgi:hypothetical protein
MAILVYRFILAYTFCAYALTRGTFRASNRTRIPVYNAHNNNIANAYNGVFARTGSGE